jgi:hypothetical protein
MSNDGTNEQQILKALSLRAQAQALLEQAAELDGLKPFQLTYVHRHGEVHAFAWAPASPDEEQVAQMLGIDFNPDQEWVAVGADLDFETLCGVRARHEPSPSPEPC